jgi:RnfABCDGE-type electron transport complex B subunit
MMVAASIGLAAATLLSMAVIIGYVLGWASRTFHVEVDPRVERINDSLPAANCGGCGYIGCNDYAEAIVHDDASVNLCAPGGPACAEAVAEIMGVEVEQTWPYRAVVHCSANTDQRLGRTEYLGEPTCSAANLVTNVQGCVYGCLGLGDCELVCDYDAIHMIDGLAKINYKKCTGCGACVDICPRHIISRIPFKAEQVLVVKCSNDDFGIDVKKVCQVGCIGCKACTRFSELIRMEGNLPVVEYEIEEFVGADFSASVDKCPMESLVFVGKPSERDLAETADELLPERIEADFKSTVDQAEWWG